MKVTVVGWRPKSETLKQTLEMGSFNFEGLEADLSACLYPKKNEIVDTNTPKSQYERVRLTMSISIEKA
jgi:hypothetical protein